MMVIFFGDRTSMAVGDSGSRLSRDTDAKSEIVYPSCARASATVGVVTQMSRCLPSTVRCSSRPRLRTTSLPLCNFAVAAGATTSWASTGYPAFERAEPTVFAVVWIFFDSPSTFRFTVLVSSTLAQATVPPMTPAKAKPHRPYMTLRRTWELLSSFALRPVADPAWNDSKQSQGTVTARRRRLQVRGQ